MAMPGSEATHQAVMAAPWTTIPAGGPGRPDRLREGLVGLVDIDARLAHAKNFIGVLHRADSS
ncbi:hypothetical protein [Rhodanobacter umsongensis]|uniref:hypothetical protein n=1 Tax=Rhodanobacter umsongensis TaxID=633153 RepID=UPI00367212CD